MKPSQMSKILKRITNQIQEIMKVLKDIFPCGQVSKILKTSKNKWRKKRKKTMSIDPH